MSLRRLFSLSRRQSFFLRSPLLLEQLEERCMLSANSLPTDLNPANVQVVSQSYATTDILVKFAQTGTNYTGLSLLPGTTVSQPLSLVPGLYEVLLSGNVTVDQALAAYRADPRVVEADLDPLLSVTGSPSGSLGSSQWGLQAINAPQAWQVTTGNPNVVVAVLDTGIDYNHPDLYSNIWINQAEIPLSRLKNLVDVYHDGYISWRDLNNPINQGPGKITDINGDGVIDAADILAPMILNAKGQDTGLGGWADGSTQDGDLAHPDDLIGWNFVDNNNQPMDDNGHGTSVAGILGATGQAGNVAGVDPNVQMMDVKWENSQGVGYLTVYLSALSYAVAHGAKIANNSWTIIGSLPTYYLNLLTTGIANAQSHGVIVVDAAGNTYPAGMNNDVNPVYPANIALNNVVVVAASDYSNGLASFSNYGANSVDLAAPGVNILNTSYLNNVPGYTSYTWTSMATPEVAGALALVWSENPDWTYQQVIQQVLSTVTPVTGLQGKVETGGLLNVAAAVGWTPADSIALQVLNAANISSSPADNLNTIQVTFSKPINPATFTTGAVTLIGPTGATISIQSLSAVAGWNNTQFNLLIANQTAPGSYTLELSSAIQDNRGHPLPTYQTTFYLIDPAPIVLSVTNVTSGAYFLGFVVTFNQPIDPSTFPRTGITLVGPNGRVLPITSILSAVNNTRFLVLIGGFQTMRGTYALRIAAGVSNPEGDRMDQYLQSLIF